MFRRVVLSSIKSPLLIVTRGIKTKLPYIQHFRTTWPEVRPTNEQIEAIPIKTVPESVLRFSLKSSFDIGMSVFYPHLKMNPADLKVTLSVSYIVILLRLSFDLFTLFALQYTCMFDFTGLYR